MFVTEEFGYPWFSFTPILYFFEGVYFYFLYALLAYLSTKFCFAAWKNRDEEIVTLLWWNLQQIPCWVGAEKGFWSLQDKTALLPSLA